MRVLLVEDDKRTAALVARALKAEGHGAELAADGDEAIAAISSRAFDVIVMDIMLPGPSGLTVLRLLRRQGNATPVLLLSARGEVYERVEGLQNGADDYLSKPFALAELLARVQALGRRTPEARLGVLRVADLKLDPATRTVERAGQLIELGTREFRLLECLMRNAGKTCSRSLIFEKVWDYSFDPGSNIIEVYFRKLCEKVDRANQLTLLQSVRGLGYSILEPQ